MNHIFVDQNGDTIATNNVMNIYSYSLRPSGNIWHCWSFIFIHSHVAYIPTIMYINYGLHYCFVVIC